MKDERATLGGRLKRYAKVGANVGGFAARAAGERAIGRGAAREEMAERLKAALGGLKGPLMKVAQMIATIPDALPEEFAVKLAELQANAPAMGAGFVRRRMAAELGPDWRTRFSEFELEAVAAASLGQVHRAADHDGRALACKLQYPDMASAVEADLDQLGLIFAIHKRMDRAIDTSEMREEIGARLREELDYAREAAHMRLYRAILGDEQSVCVPEPVAGLSTPRLLTMSWLDGVPVLSHRDSALSVRNALATALFRAWWRPFSSHGVIHGDPHLGNYAAREDHGLNLLDFGCIRTFRPDFVKGVIDLYRAMLSDDRDLAVLAFETWGFKGLSNETIDVLTIWARFIYAPMLEDRVRSVADGIRPGQYGRREAAEVHGALKRLGPVRIPRAFVFMDRAAIGLGAVFLHLGAELNFHRLFETEIEGFDAAAVAARQKTAFAAAGVPLPD